jgi:hypothetical protein
LAGSWLLGSTLRQLDLGDMISIEQLLEEVSWRSAQLEVLKCRGCLILESKEAFPNLKELHLCYAEPLVHQRPEKVLEFR